VEVGNGGKTGGGRLGRSGNAEGGMRKSEIFENGKMGKYKIKKMGIGVFRLRISE
jgi:hypothetical protein